MGGAVKKTAVWSWGGKDLAPRHGFEPRFTAPKAAVLPLDDRGMDGENSPSQCSVSGCAAATRQAVFDAAGKLCITALPTNAGQAPPHHQPEGLPWPGRSPRRPPRTRR